MKCGQLVGSKSIESDPIDLTFNEPAPYSFPYVCLSSWGKEKIDFEVDIPINLRSITPGYWPEAPTENSILVYGQEAIVSFNWKKLASKPV